MSARLIVLTLILNSFSSVAAELISHGVEVPTGCRQKMGTVLNRITSGSPRVHAADLGTLREALEAAYHGEVLQSVMVDSTMGLIENAMFGNAAVVDPLAATIQNELKRSMDDPNGVLICIISGKCRVGTQSLYAAGAFPYDIVPESGVWSTKPFQWLRAKFWKKPDPSPDTIYLNADASSNLDLAHGLFEEVLKVHDMRLVSEWMKKNQELKNAGKEPDSLFTKHVQERDGKLQIGEGFLRVFLMSRGAWGANRMLRYAMGPNSEFAHLVDRKGAYELGTTADAIRLFPASAAFFKKHNLESANLLELGRQWEQQMNDTVSRNIP